uniref:DUF7869 domain-containing protein n=1 Tax=Graphocephala atropunctata TaxID=36148 RepID=A0A1B6LBY1_9HEMI
MPSGLPEAPKCSHNGPTYRCKSLRMSDIQEFHGSFYKTPVKTVQDSFILKHIEVSMPKRDRSKKNGGKKSVSVKYFVKVKGTTKFKIQVCQNTFLGVLNVSRFRVNNIAKNFAITGRMPVERRGGYRLNEQFHRKRESVKSFIETLKGVESHYCRGKSARQYLSCELNISKLLKMYNKSVSDPLKVKRTFFRNIFCQCYNVGFGSPVTDACSKCIELREKIKVEQNQAAKSMLMTQLRVHILRGKAFFAKLKVDDPQIITFSFDCQKNLTNPKVPDQAAYYSRQLYTYNLTIVQGSSKAKMTTDNVFTYTWMEHEYKKGSNEVCSAVFDVLSKTDFSTYKLIRLFADGCGGQNRNSIMVNMLSYFLMNNAPNNIKKIELIFPVPGHSFLPPDRVFGRIEKELKNLPNITNPKVYVEVFAKHATVRTMGEDCNVYNWKAAAIDYMKPLKQWHFKFNLTKRFIFSRNIQRTKVLVRGERSYNSDYDKAFCLTKASKFIKDIELTVIPKGVSVKKAKLKDVCHLLKKHFGDGWDKREDLEFFNTLMAQNGQVPEEDVPEEEDYCEGHHEENEDFVV